MARPSPRTDRARPGSRARGRPRPRPRASAARAEAIDEAYTALRRTIGGFHRLHRHAPGGQLAPGEAAMLRILARRGPTSPKVLAEFIGIAQATVTSLLDKLESRGLVQRSRSTEDRRAVVVRLTPRARGMMERVDAEARAQLAQVFEGWSVAEIQTLRRLLDRLAEGARGGC